MAFDGVVKLPSSLVIETDTTVGASGHTVTLDGNNAARHFVVTNGVSLRLVNLTLINGRFVGDPVEVLKVGSPGMGSCIYHAGGALELTGCRFLNNQVR